MSIANVLQANNYNLYVKNLQALKCSAVNFAGASGAINYQNGGITSVTRASAGLYNVDYTLSAFANANVFIQATALHASGCFLVVQANPTAFVCQIKCFAVDGTTPLDPTAIYLNVFAN